MSPPARALRALSFDLDGTLYDSQRARSRLLVATFPRWRTLRVGRGVREEMRGQSFVDGAALLQEEARIVAERLERDAISTQALLRDLFEVRLLRVLARVGPRPGTRALLQRLLDDGLKIAVISDRGAVAAKLAALGLGDLAWGALVSADEEGHLKPAAALFQRCAQRLGVDVSEMLHVGDRDDADGAGARAAGAPVAILGTRALPSLDALLSLVPRPSAVPKNSLPSAQATDLLHGANNEGDGTADVGSGRTHGPHRTPDPDSQSQ